MLDLEMAEGQLGVDLVLVAAAHPGPIDVSGIDQVVNDPLHGPMSDPGPFGHVCHPDRRVLRQTQEDDQVAGDESPLAI